MGETIERSSIADLVEYYRRSLALERQGEASLSDREFFGTQRREPRFYPVASLAETWEEMLSTPAAQKGFRQVERQEGAVLLFAPYLAALRDGEDGERRWEPVGGVYCFHDAQGKRVDPADLFIGRPLGEEISAEDLAAVRAAIEEAARQSPLALERTLRELLQRHELPISTATEYSDIVPPAIVQCAGFWVVGQPSYDRALLEELEGLRRSTVSNTALSFLLRPPAAGHPDFDDVLSALANPICPTLSQAIALAAATRYPLTVITGPPGTGKTRLIVGLIIHHLLAGRSVLLASRVNRAVDAAVELTERLIGKGGILRTGNEHMRTQLVETLGELTGRSHWEAEGELFASLSKDRACSSTADGRLVHRASEDLRSYGERIARLCHRLNGQAHRLQTLGMGPEGDWWTRLWWRIRWWLQNGERRVRELSEAWEEIIRIFDELDRRVLPAARQARTLALRRRLEEMFDRGGPMLRELMTAMTDPRERLRAFEKVVQFGFPVAVTTLSIGQNLPLSPGLFDTLIVDEASSCDPASLLPLLYRARRAVIVGDPKQLDHVTRERWKRIASVPHLRSVGGKRIEASFGVSAFALMHQLLDGETFWLADHFRCPPPIIAFANETFYGGRLRIHTVEQESQPILVRRVTGPHRTHGVTRSLTNQAQIQEALAILVEWAERYPEQSLGLVAPYRAFVDNVLERLQNDQALDQLRKKRDEQQLIIGTAHRFQGSEVDYLVFATVAGDNATDQHRQWIESPNLFNVAITRARRQLLILISPEFERRLVLTKQLFQAMPMVLGAVDVERDPFTERIILELERRGLRYRMGCRYRGDLVDFLEDREPPRWGLLCCSWTKAVHLTPLDALELWDRQRALWRHGISVWMAFPLTLDQLFDRLMGLASPQPSTWG
ncbi:MAG: AAA domain-containing protein [Blastocatellia bacterium]|nr:AAA domain-containing protein [Blastocatellia bacterium]MCX7752551.1 AAA domain-containing protein [Blastocatellia bacterium]MDW8167333.1 AAA domain-containing protein [Acidobacteriota bacterium]